MVALLTLALARIACGGEEGRGKAKQQWPPGIAVVYARLSASHTYQVIWKRDTGPGDARMVYETWRHTFDAVPSDFGFVPSPDGRWVHIWETLYHREGGARNKTVWLTVELPTGRRLKIGEKPRRSGYYPYWLDDHRLLLEKGDYRTVFDLETRRLTRALEAPSYPRGQFRSDRDLDPEDKRALAWGRQYVRCHYSAELDRLRSALAILDRQLGISTYLREREFPPADAPEDFLLRPMGLVNDRSKFVWPGVAVSSDGELIARTAFLVTGRKEEEDLRGGRFSGFAFSARIGVYRLPSGEFVWGKSVEQRVAQSGDAPMYSRHGDLGLVVDPWFRDPRWSRDGRYLSFTTRDEPSGKESVSVVDSSTWEVVLHIPNATNAFVIPVVE